MKIECTLPFASDNISGIQFERTEAGTMVSVEDVPEAEAERLLRIEGFRVAEQAAKPAAKTKKDDGADDSAGAGDAAKTGAAKHKHG